MQAIPAQPPAPGGRAAARDTLAEGASATGLTTVDTPAVGVAANGLAVVSTTTDTTTDTTADTTADITANSTTSTTAGMTADSAANSTAEITADSTADSTATSVTTDPLASFTSPWWDKAASAYRASVRWESKYVRRLLLLDALAAVGGGATAYLVRFGGLLDVDLPTMAGTYRQHLLMTALLPVAWVLAMAWGRAYESRFLGGGSEEFRRVINSAARLTAIVAVLSYATKAELARTYLLIAFPVAAILTLAGRMAARGQLHRLRRRGRGMHRVLVVGSGESAATLVRTAQRDPTAGWSVVGICLDRAPGRHSHDAPERSGFDLLGVPFIGTLDSLESAIAATHASTVAICPQVDSESLRRTLWMLEGSDVHVLVSSALTEVTGPRISIRPVAGLPLLHIEEPELTGTRRFVKTLVDRTLALGAVLTFLPLLLAVAAAVRFTSSGPAFFRQTRVGRDGKPFTMFKFRSMYTDAEARLAGLQQHNERAEGLLFKMRDDPRVTPVGRFLRKWSLDELPQLINVINGSMSLVGPRPPLPAEVAQYETDVHRRLMVKPGLTGIWQISGRSDLEWDESVRLDLRYVENWSLAMDFVILWRTLFAVLRREGAY